MIVTKDAESVISLFEALGFEKRHTPTVDIGTAMVTSTRMRNADGFYVDIADVNRFIKQFNETKKVMKQFSGAMKPGKKGFKMPFFGKNKLF